MKKTVYLIISALVITILLAAGKNIFTPFNKKNEATSVASLQSNSDLKQTKSALIASNKTNQLRYEKAANKVVPIASLTKLMTAYITIKAINKGQLSKREKLRLDRVDDPAAVSLQNKTRRSTYSVQDLLAAMLIMSANDAAETLGNRMAGNEDDFAAKMNKEARALGLSNKTHFTSASGLDNDQGETSVSTAKDLLKLVNRLTSTYPEITKITSKAPYTLADGNEINTTNPLLIDGEKNIIGLKTGFTDQAGYCLIAIKQIGTEKKTAIILGSKSEETRKNAAYSLLNV